MPASLLEEDNKKKWETMVSTNYDKRVNDKYSATQAKPVWKSEVSFSSLLAESCPWKIQNLLNYWESSIGARGSKHSTSQISWFLQK